METAVSPRPAKALVKGASVVVALLLILLMTGCSGSAGKTSGSDVPTLVIENPNGTEATITAADAHQMPAGIPDCPDESILLAWAELPNGWVLVCGISQDEPTLWISSIDGQEYRSESVTYTAAASSATQVGGAAYQADLGAKGDTQLTFSPATFSMTDGSDAIAAQSAVLIVFFVDLGYSAPAEGSGAFDLDAPADTADDQVRYLAELLETSYEGRAQLQGAVAAIETCSSPAAVKQGVKEVEDVRDNRAYLLSALASAPVDQVPDGVRLLNELVKSIQYSYEADLAYLQWGEQVRDRGCGSGSRAEGDRYSSLAGPQKEVFSSLWNRVIAPKFDVQTIDAGKL